MRSLELVYSDATDNWFSALPLGNGFIGAMVFGGTQKEKISMNLDSLWSGDGHYKGKYVSANTWDTIKNSIVNSELLSAKKSIEDEVLCDWTECFLPAGNILFDFDNVNKINDYKRTLSLNDAMVFISFKSDGITYEREMFTSMAENVFAIKLSAKKDNKLIPFDFSISMDSQLNYECNVSNNEIIINGKAPSYCAPNYFDTENPIKYEDGKGIKYNMVIRVLSNSVTVNENNKSLSVNSDGECFIYFSGNTNFIEGDNYIEKTRLDIYNSISINYTQLKERHIKKYRQYFYAFDFTLNSIDKYNDTKKLLCGFNGEDNYLYELMFHYSRYLMIASSSNGSECSTLQGIWNKDIRAPWSSNYTVNINTQMNYWFVESVGLGECHNALFKLIERTYKTGQVTAKDMYNSDGWVSHHNIDIWGHSTPVGLGSSDDNPCSYSMWQMSSGWLCRHLWEHYLYTLDKDFLKNFAYPIISSAVGFYINNLKNVDVFLGLIPSTSPENVFVLEDGNKYAISYFTTMETSILKELFNYYIKMCNLIDVKEDYRVHDVLKKLPDFKISEKGYLQEWYFDYKESDDKHRHVSHLYGLYPSNIIKEDEHELIKACKKTLKRRGDCGTGWSMMWKACLYARLKDGEKCKLLLDKQLCYTNEERVLMSGGGTYCNLFCAHPPFQIDANFGFAAAVVEMLVQSHNNKLEFLPALPYSWATGKVENIILRGGYRASFSWNDRKITILKIVSKFNKKVNIKYNGREETVYFDENMTFSIL